MSLFSSVEGRQFVVPTVHLTSSLRGFAVSCSHIQLPFQPALLSFCSHCCHYDSPVMSVRVTNLSSMKIHSNLNYQHDCQQKLHLCSHAAGEQQ